MLPRRTCYIGDIKPEMDGFNIVIYGWIHSVRDIGRVKFIVLRDRTGKIQIIARKNSINEEKFKHISDLARESILWVRGIVQKSGIAKAGVEILLEDYGVISEAKPLPIEIWSPDINTQFAKRVEYRYLDLRRPEVQALFKIRAKAQSLIRRFLEDQGFMEINTPKIVLMGAESGADVFEVNYFSRQAYLSQSPQLYKQMLMSSGIEKVYEIAAYWRAEKSHTSRHLTEFWMLDVEVSFIDNIEDILKLLEDMMVYVISELKDEEYRSLEVLNVKLNTPKSPFPRVTIREAYKILAENGKILQYGDDLDTEAEEKLGEIFRKNYNSEFLFVLEFPWVKSPFYSMRKEDEPEWVIGFDLLYKGLEIASGKQREHRYEKLLQNVIEKKLKIDTLKWYLESFKYGMPPHGGFGFGIDRFIKQMLNLEDIREAILFPRDPERIHP
jgi:aspartyl-tRNA synthetase